MIQEKWKKFEEKQQRVSMGWQRER